MLSEAEIREIVLADGELDGFAFVSQGEVVGLVTPLPARRVALCLDAVEAGRVAALENGSPAVWYHLLGYDEQASAARRGSGSARPGTQTLTL